MTLKTYLRILRDRWKIVALFALLTTGLAVLITYLTPREYQSHAQLFVASNGSSDPLSQYQAAAFAQAQVSSYAQIVDAVDVLHAVRRDLNLPLSDAQLRAKLSATAPAQSTLINIYATDGSPSMAAALANSAARAFITTIEKYATSTKTDAPSVRLFVTAPASAPTVPIAPKAGLNIGLGLFLGLLIGVALAVARETLDNRIKSADALAEITDLPVMGIVVNDPKTDRHPIATRAGAHNIRAESYRQLRANLQFANVDAHPRVIAVTSSIPNEGKTTVAINLASTLAEAGFSVCLVEADLRQPTIAKLLGLSGAVGLTNVLIHQIELTAALQQAAANLYILTSGPTPPNPSEVLASSYMRDVIHSLLDKFDYVVLDTAPLLPVADGAEVSALADGALLVTRYGETTDAQVIRAIEHLRQVDAHAIGVVLNRIPVSRDRDLYGYQYHRATTEPSPSPSPSPRRGNRRNSQAQHVKPEAASRRSDS